MRREHIQKALEAACKVSNHHEFVVAGSLSVLGILNHPPEKMSMSTDIDFYPLRDPGRASEIASALGEFSDFHERNGYYLDPISPELPVLPDGWHDRMIKVVLGQSTAYFLDVNDTAVSKYARSAQNDYRWIEAGYEAGILDLGTIENRVRFSTTFYDDEDRRKTTNGLLMHRTAMQPDGSLSKGMLEYMHAHPPLAQIKEIDRDHGRYLGLVLWADDSYAVQSLGRGDVIIHNVRDWPTTKPTTNDKLVVSYRGGKAFPEIKTPGREHNLSSRR